MVQYHGGDSDRGYMLVVRDLKYKTSDEQVLVTFDRLKLDIVRLNIVTFDVQCEARGEVA